ncbi:MAG: DsrE family protein [Egibacteraceae bacterium]
MADSVAVMISSGGRQAVATALDLLAAAVAMEMEVHLYFTGEAIVWVGRGEEPQGDDAEAVRQDVAARLRELKKDGTVSVHACSRAMRDHGIPPDHLAPEVDMPAGFAYFLDLASRATITLNF